MKTSEFVLYNFLVESNFINEKEFSLLTESSKVETLKTIAMSILHNISNQVNSGELTFIDKSKGDFKQFKEYSTLTTAIEKLDELFSAKSDLIPVGLKDKVSTIAKSILYLNQYSNQFKDAYRNRKTLLILKYQSIILSIVSAVSYLLSIVVDFSENEAKLNLNVRYENIAPFKTLENFVKSVDNGEFSIILRDVQAVREVFNENQNLEEALSFDTVANFGSILVNGLKNIYNDLNKDGKLVTALYKAAGVVVLILSLREIFYCFGNMRTKVNDMISQLKVFNGLGSTIEGVKNSALDKLKKFTGQCKLDCEYGSEMAERAISQEDKMISNSVNPTNLRVFTPEDPSVEGGQFDTSIFNF